MASKIRYESKERWVERHPQPTEELVRTFMGADAWRRLMRLEELLRERYDLHREMKFPFGNEYGWSFRYTHKKALLLYVFFEKGGFCCTLSINDAGAPKVEAMLNELRPEIQSAWKSRYACGAEGGWLNRSVASHGELPDLVRLAGVKVKQKKEN